MNTLDVDIKKYSFLLYLFIFIEIILIGSLVKSFLISLFWAFLFLATFLLFVLPEFGFAFALTGNILMMILFDHIKMPISAPTLFFYLIAVLGGITIYILKEGFDEEIKFGWPVKMALALGLLMVAGLAYSTDPAYGLKKVLFYFLYNFLLLTLPIVFLKDIKKLENIFIMVFLIGLILSIVTSFIAFHTSAFVRFSPSESVNPIWLSRSLAISFLCGVYLFIRSRSSMLRLLLIFLAPLFLYPMFRSWSRAPLMGLFAAVFLFYLLQPAQPFSRKIKLGIPIIVGGLVLLLHSSTQITQRLETPLANEWSTAFRLLAWFKGIKAFFSAPMLGIGTGSFTMKVPFMVFKYPHNLFVEIASENGIIALVLTLVFTYLFIRLGFRTIKIYYQIKDEKAIQLSILSFVIFLYTLWNSMFSGAVYANENIWFAAGMIYLLNVSATSSLPAKKRVLEKEIN